MSANMTPYRLFQKTALLGALLTAATLAQAQDSVKLANLVELSGPGTTAGTLFKNGVELAIKEINAGGGILGKKITYTTEDTQSNPGVAKGLTQKAVDNEVFAIFGPVYSGSIMVSMAESKRGEVPNFTGGEAAAITAQGNPYVFRTSFGQSVSFPKLVRYVNTKSQKLALIYVNNDFGKGGRDSLIKLLEGTPTKLVADISTDAGQVDFSAAVLKAKQSDADAVLIYTNEEESARALRELRKQGWKKPMIGETTLTGQKVIELAGDAANGAVAPRGPDHRRTAAEGLRSQVQGRVQVGVRPQRHQGLHRGLHPEGRHREGGQARPQGRGGRPARRLLQHQATAQHPDGRVL